MSATSIEARTGSTVGGGFFRLEQAELVQRTRHRADSLGCHLGVEGGVVELYVSEKDLDDPDVCAVLQQVGGEAMAQRMRPDPLGNVGGPGRFHDNPIELPCADRLHRVLTWE